MSDDTTTISYRTISVPTITAQEIAAQVARRDGSMNGVSDEHKEAVLDAIRMAQTPMTDSEIVMLDRLGIIQRKGGVTTLGALCQHAAYRLRELEAPIPLLIHCPRCQLQHVDVDDESGKWATARVHKKHLCKESDGGCGHVFKVSNRFTVGVRELPEVEG